MMLVLVLLVGLLLDLVLWSILLDLVLWSSRQNYFHDVGLVLLIAVVLWSCAVACGGLVVLLVKIVVMSLLFWCCFVVLFCHAVAAAGLVLFCHAAADLVLLLVSC